MSQRIEDKSSSSSSSSTPSAAPSILSSIMGLSKRSKHLLHWFIGLFSLLTILYRWSTNSLVAIIVLALFTLYLINGGYRFCYIFLRTAHRDAISLARFLRTRLFILKLKNRNSSVPKIFQQMAQANPGKTLFHFGDDHWTMEQVDRFSNRVANYFIREGFEKGDVIALFMDNRPEYVALWLGLAKAGIIASLINHNQRSHSLIHSLRVVNCKALIFGSDLSEAVDKIHADLESKNGTIGFYRFNTNTVPPSQNSNCCCCCSSKNLWEEMANISPEPPQDRIDNVSFNDCLLYIYTSGTEGMPKAAIIKNSRFIYIGAVVKYMINITESDILYTSLPLYHLSAGTVGVCQSLIFGNTMVIRSKFSASNFWKDCVRYRCTVAQYIGEICRYLLSQPESPFDQTHSIRMMFGNGLRPNIWKDFVTRFNIKQIGELYGSTEGNANIINVDNKEGACGFISQILPSFYPATLIRIDEQTGQPVRNDQGLCVKVQPGEAGELVAKIIHGDPSRAFDGYASKEATKKKIIYNVFRHGDCAFTTGDLLTMDQFGYLYFNDRCGDTFRWKGENISTMELEAIISNTLQLADCIVYGVEIPGCEGKAGMAAILDQNHSIDPNKMLEQLRSQLPMFMIPVFVRLVDQLEITATHKMPKVTYRNQGFNIKLIEDPIYFLDTKNFRYIRMNQTLYDDLLKGNFRI